MIQFLTLTLLVFSQVGSAGEYNVYSRVAGTGCANLIYDLGFAEPYFPRYSANWFQMHNYQSRPRAVVYDLRSFIGERAEIVLHPVIDEKKKYAFGTPDHFISRFGKKEIFVSVGNQTRIYSGLLKNVRLLQERDELHLRVEMDGLPQSGTPKRISLDLTIAKEEDATPKLLLFRVL